MYRLTKRELQRIRQGDALLVLENQIIGRVRRVWGKNIVTTAGDIYYAQSACGESPANAFSRLYLATACSESGGDPIKTSNYSHFTVVAGSEKAPTGGYPRTDCADGDNTGAGTNVVTWKYEYSTGDGPFTNITHSLISIASASGSDPILNGYKWASAWSKDGSTSAKIFANHEVEGT